MSSVAFGALTTRREKSDSGKSKSEQPPGVNSYIDILAALVPAEVLAIHALVISTVTKTSTGGQTSITDPTTLRWAFWLLMGLSSALFVLGRQSQRLEWQDIIRFLIPPAAFAGWVMLQTTSVWNAVVPNMSSGTRLLIPLVGAVLLAAVTKALAAHSDKKLSPAQREASTRAVSAAAQKAAQKAAAQKPAEQKAAQPEPAAGPETESGQTVQPAEEEPVPGRPPPEPSPASAGPGPEDKPPVPNWVY